MSTLAALLLPPLAATLTAIVVRPYRAFVGWLTLAAAAVSFAAAVRLAAEMLRGVRDVPVPSGLWHVDALSALLALCITFVTLLASALAPGLGEVSAANASEVRRLRTYMAAFAFTMLLAVSVQSVALMWVAIEATTIASALAIPLHRTRASVEASWKYLLVCSVGIALAFAGTILAYFGFVATAGQVPGALNWSVLRATAPALDPTLMRMAFAFILIGYGTKAGLAPMHTWLPDAHSEAPPAISAMMSGVLLAVATYAIARWKSVVDSAVDPSFTNGLLLGFGLLSVAIGALSLVIQRHYKRMLAYSSLEHMGLVTVGLTLGPAGMFAAWLHVMNHAVAKSASFLLAGRILHRYRTAEIAGVSGLMRVMPWTGGLFALGVLALVGLPPFGLFVSEYLLVQAAVVSRRWWLAAALLALLLTTFVSLISHLNRMLYGDAPDDVRGGEGSAWPLAALTLPAALLVVLGIALPSPLSSLIDRSVNTLLH
ncbi:MAG TPA: proton-conducting transporter membrane subunit [Vicinamibacterales bacterium]|nr:proton-conducting transporter membrane subunit [Vicinamibacterales bacterium]